MTAKLSDPERDQAAQTVALFSVLIHAWYTNDSDQAAHTRDELDRRGVQVELLGQRRAREGATHE